MKDELQTKLVEILTAIQSATGKASDFAMEQLPDIAQSYILYGRSVYTAIFLLLAFAAAVCWYVAIKKGLLNHAEVFQDGYSKGEWKTQRLLATGLGSAGAFFLTFGAIDIGGRMLLVWLAPKVWLLQELARMVR